MGVQGFIKDSQDSPRIPKDFPSIPCIPHPIGGAIGNGPYEIDDLRRIQIAKVFYANLYRRDFKKLIMDTYFHPKLNCLPAAQRRFWNELDAVPEEFVLYGGTALVLHLGHRESLDFDFFGNLNFDPARLREKIPFLSGVRATQQEPNTLSAIIHRDGPVKVSFFGVPGIRRIKPPHIAPDNGLRIASLLDLAGTKAAVVQQRAEAKDYLDIDAILRDGQIDLPTALAAARIIYGPVFNPQITLKALSFFADGNLARLPREVQDRLAKAAREVDLDKLPEIGIAHFGEHPGRVK